MPIKPKKFKHLLIAALILLIIGIAGVGYVNYRQKDNGADQAKAAELVKKVEEKPEVGIEAIDAETMASVKKSISTYPGFLVKLEIDRQLGEKYITQKQHDELIKMVDDYAKNNKIESSPSSAVSELSSQSSSI